MTTTPEPHSCDKILISDLHLETIIGLYPQERRRPQPLIIDIELGTNFTPVFDSDDLSQTLDYATIKQHVHRLCMDRRFDLLESLAGYLLRNLFASFPALWIRLTIRKPQALQDAMAGIETFRTREQMGVPFTQNTGQS
ncbi:MAG: dihydroneopterin aldolase [Kistimonas sp.]|nr:dihydroneopterin aldolase [Kistimonas sp.]